MIIRRIVNVIFYKMLLMTNCNAANPKKEGLVEFEKKI